MPTVTRQTRTGRKKRSGVLGRIAPVSLEDCGVKINLYGRSGTGKTTLAASFPKPLLHIVCSAVGKGESRSIARIKGISDVELLDSEELGVLTKHIAEGSYKTVVLDHATGLQDLVLKEILGGGELPVGIQKHTIGREQYGLCAVQMKERLRALLGLACHVVIIAQEREFNTEGDGELLSPFVASALTPSVTGWLNPACDYICHTFIRQRTIEKPVKIGKKTITKRVPVKGVEYCLRTAPDAVYTTKFRLPKGTELPEVIVDPSFAKIEQLIK